MTAPIQISGGNYPLIQQPNPFMELAATIHGIQQERDARAMQTLQRQQLLAGIQHLAAQTALTQGQTAMLPAEQARLQAETGEQQALTKFHEAQTGTVEEQQKKAKRTDEQYRSAVAPLNAALAVGVDPTTPQYRTILSHVLGSVDDADARKRILDEFHNVVQGAQAATAAATAQAEAAARQRFNTAHPGLAGYAATPGGLAYKAAEDRIAAENARLGAGANSMQQRMALGAGTLSRIIPMADALEQGNAGASSVPLTTDVGTAVVGRLFGADAGRRLQQRLMSAGSSTDQGRYQALRTQFKEAMAAFYPRASAPLMDVLADSYFAIPGESPANREAKRQDRAALLQTIQNVQTGRLPRAALDSQLGGRLSADQSIQLLNSGDVHPADSVDPREFLPDQQ